MKIALLGAVKTVMSNPQSKHNYFGWPTAVRLKNGKIAVVASGFRLDHVCPFGKAVISYSEDEGETFSSPATVIDTVLDDRDGGIAVFGNAGVIVTSFNNTVFFQRDYAEKYTQNKYALAYLDTVTAEEEAAALGATYRMSLDHGVTFGALRKSPITSPHGPIELLDGRILWVGRRYDISSLEDDQPEIEVYEILCDGEMQKVGAIDRIEGLLSCEPHMAEAKDGTLITHIRVQEGGGATGAHCFTVYQSESHDGGKSWSVPHKILSDLGGAPSHILRTCDCRLIATYGYREAPYGIRMMVSTDHGKSWETDHVIHENGVNLDLGYPSTVELADGSFLTVFYAHRSPTEPATILAQRWKFI